MDDRQKRGASPKGKPGRWLALLLVVAAGVVVVGVIGVDAVIGTRLKSNPSGSNAPTLLVGDYFTINTRAYNVRDPLRGDLVIFKLPSDNSVDFVKRVIGLPGDKVQIRGGAVYINGAEIPRTRVEDYEDSRGGALRRYTETLSNTRSYPTLDADTDGPGDDTPEYVVPAEHYFLMGDNRDRSLDSRNRRVGYVPRKNIYARAGIIIYAKEISRIGVKLN